MTMVSRGLVIGLMLAVAAPVAAQTAPPAPPAGEGRQSYNAGEGRMMHHGGMGHGKRAFASMSDAGRATMREAMRGDGDRRAEHEQVKAARDRMLTLLEADRLDTSALKRAMDDERNAANASRERRQAAMLEGFAKLSVADRKAFVADSRAMKSRMEERVQKWRERRREAPPAI